MVTTLNKLQSYLSEIEKNDKRGKKINAFLQLNPHVVEEAKKIDEKILKKKLENLQEKLLLLKQI